MAENIFSFHAGREAAMCGGARDARRSAGWLEGYDSVAGALNLPAPDPSGWQPIETAPKDGTRILCYAPAGPKNATVVRARSSAMRVDRRHEKYKWKYGRELPEAPYTHWMPLPAPPEPS